MVRACVLVCVCGALAHIHCWRDTHKLWKQRRIGRHLYQNECVERMKAEMGKYRIETCRETTASNRHTHTLLVLMIWEMQWGIKKKIPHFCTAVHYRRVSHWWHKNIPCFGHTRSFTHSHTHPLALSLSDSRNAQVWNQIPFKQQQPPLFDASIHYYHHTHTHTCIHHFIIIPAIAKWKYSVK